MISDPIYVEHVLPQPPWEWTGLNNRKKTDVLPIPPFSKLPSETLPSQSRVDYRRLCEVEHNVCCRNIGLISKDCLKILDNYAAILRSLPNHDPKIIEDVDVMDLS